MKNKLTIITSGFIVAFSSVTLCAPAAMASPLDTEINAKGASFTQSQPNEVSQADSRNTLNIGASYSAKVVLNDSKGPQVIDVTEGEKTLSSLLETKEINLEDYRSSNAATVKSDYQLKNNENLVLFKSETSGDSSVIELKAPEVKKESNELFLGEEKVESEGKNGQALKTVITVKNLATDSNLNTDAKALNADLNSTEEKLTILQAPESKVTLIGTKEVPAPAAPIAEPAAPVATTLNTNNAPAAAPAKAVEAPAAAPAAKAPVSGSIASLVSAQLGKPYIYGAAGPSAFDCSGLVYWIFATNNGYNIPRTAYAQGLASTPVNPADVQPGDIVWIPAHIGIYVGNGMIVHASSPETGVITGELKHYLAAGYKIGRF